MADILCSDPPPIFCSAEWHLRDHPSAIGIYTLALHLTRGGEREFYLSQPQLAYYFNWNEKTVRRALRALRESGLFRLLRSGKNSDRNFANVYRVLTHAQLASTGEHECWIHPDFTPWDEQESTSESNEKCVADPLPETGTLVYKAPQTPLPKSGSTPLPEIGTLVYD